MNAAPALEAPVYRVRAAKVSDLPFVVGSWVHADRHAKDGWYTRTTRIRDAKAYVRGVLARDAAVCLVACDPQDEDAIWGWCCFERDPNVCHYVFVRPEFRRFGIAKALVGSLAQAPAVYRHQPRTRGLPIPPGWMYEVIK